MAMAEVTMCSGLERYCGVSGVPQEKAGQMETDVLNYLYVRTDAPFVLAGVLDHDAGV